MIKTKLMLYIIILLFLNSCKRNINSVDTTMICENSEICRNQSTLGYYCGDADKYTLNNDKTIKNKTCQFLKKPDRVVSTYPSDLLENPSEYKDYIVFGVIGPYNYPETKYLVDAINMAIIEFNQSIDFLIDKNGNIRKFATIVMTHEENYKEDGFSEEEASIFIANLLTDVYAIKTIIGPSSSDMVEIVFKALENRPDKERPVIISSSATSNTLTSLENTVINEYPGLLWRTIAPDHVQTDTLLNSLSGRHIKNIAIINQEGLYGDGIAEIVHEKFTLNGNTSKRFTYPSSASKEFIDDQLMQALQEEGLQEILFVSAQPIEITYAINFLASIDDFNHISLLLTDVAANPYIIDNTTNSEFYYHNIRGTRPSPKSGNLYDFFKEKFKIRNPDINTDEYTFLPYAYDATIMSIFGNAWAVLQENKHTGRSVAKGFRELNKIGATKVKVDSVAFSVILEHFRRGDPVDIEGASGHLDYDSQTEETTTEIKGFCLGENEYSTFSIILCDIEKHHRILFTYPKDLLTKKELYADYTILGSINNFSTLTGLYRADAIQLALEEINSIEGSPKYGMVFTNISISQKDNLTVPEASVFISKYLVDNFSTVIIGPPGSANVEAVFTSFESEADITKKPLIISMSATSNLLTDLEPEASYINPGLLWRTAPPDSAQVQRILESFEARNITNIAIVNELGPYGDSIAEYIHEYFIDKEYTSERFTYALGSPKEDIESQLMQAIEIIGAQEILFVSADENDAIIAIKYIAENQPNISLFFTDGSIGNGLHLETATHSFYYPNIRGTEPISDKTTNSYENFKTNFEARNLTAELSNTTFVEHSYDATWMAIYGVVWAIHVEESLTSRNIARGLRQLTDTTKAPISIGIRSWFDIENALRTHNTVNIEGASGSLDYDLITEETTGIINTWCLESTGVKNCDINIP